MILSNLFKFVSCWSTSLEHALFCISLKTKRRKCSRNLFNSCFIHKFTVPAKQVCLCSHRIFFFMFVRSPAGPTLSISVYINQYHKQTKTNQQPLISGSSVLVVIPSAFSLLSAPGLKKGIWSERSNKLQNWSGVMGWTAGQLIFPIGISWNIKKEKKKLQNKNTSPY